MNLPVLECRLRPRPGPDRIASAAGGDDNGPASLTAWTTVKRPATTHDTLPMTSSFAYMHGGTHPPAGWRRALAVAALVTAFTLAGPASARTPPTAEVSAAQAAIVRAESVDADQYAADAIIRAREALALAQAAIAARKHDDARRLAELASAEADLAHARSRDATARAELAQRRAEVVELRAKLGMEGAP